MIVKKVFFEDKECKQGYQNGVLIYSGSRVPDNLVEVTYVGSTSKSYSTGGVQTDMLIQNVDSFDCKVEWTDYASGTSSYAAIFGAIDNTSPNYSVFARMLRNQTDTPKRGLQLKVGKDASIPYGTAITLNTVYEVIGYGKGDTYTINGETFSLTKNTLTAPNDLYLGLFCDVKRNTNGTYAKEAGAHSRIYYLKFYDNGGNLIHNFIPVRYKDDSKYGLYDTVTKTTLDIPKSNHSVGADV